MIISRSMLRLPAAVLICFVTVLSVFVPAQYILADDGERIDQYTTRHTDPQGKVVYRVIVPGSPPPATLMKSATLGGAGGMAAGNVLAHVPAFNWCYGCSATAAAMLAGYYDQPARGYSNIYTGPANGGICPLNNETFWSNTAYPATCAQAVTCGNMPLVASKNGIDGRAARGSVEDYWQAYNCAGDAYSGHWQEHPADSLADFMGTSQWVKYGSGYGNPDGSTSFWYTTGNEPLYDYTGMEPFSRDGGHGIKLFLESRGYTVTGVFNQRIYGFGGIPAGFSYEQYKAEIDAGRPVIIQVTGHTMLGTGYNDSGNIIYIHDTWDHELHSMVWGGYYYGMQHRGVTVLRMAPAPSPAAPTLLSPASGAGITGTSVTLQWGAAAGATQYRPEVSSSPSFNGAPVYSATVSVTSQSISLPGGPGSTYYWRVYAGNEANRWSAPSQIWNFIQAGPGLLIGTYPPPSSSAGGTAITTPAPPVAIPTPTVRMANQAANAELPGTPDTAADMVLVFSITLLSTAFILGIIALWRGRQRI